MANEIHFTGSLSVFKPAVMAQATGMSFNDLIASMTGNVAIGPTSILVALAGTAIPLGQVTQPHWAAFYSNPLYNTITQGAATTITGAANNGSGLVRITDTAHGYITGDFVTIAGVGGTVEANGNWPITVITANTFDLVGSAFAVAYTSGGTAVLNSSIQLRNGSAGASLGQLFPGEAAILPLLVGSTPYAYASPTLQNLDYAIFSW
jgi:hypothetical protein